MANHTPEPWKTDELEIFIFGNDGNLTATPFMCAGRPSETANANARRIVACVNACAGIPTEDLEKVNKPVDDKFHNGYRIKLECLGGC